MLSMSANSSMTLGLKLMGAYPYHTLAVLFLGYMLFRLSKKDRNSNPKGLPLPPGPKSYQLIRALPRFNKPWLVYEEWCKIYGKFFMIIWPIHREYHSTFLGDMIYFNIFGQHFVILGSQKRVNDLLEKRSANYSDRMQFHFLVEV